MNNPVVNAVRQYYGEVLQSSLDLKTSACCTLDSIPPALRKLLADIHPTTNAAVSTRGACC
jgi:hypothetical protein